LAGTKVGSIAELFERHGAMVFRRCRHLLGNDQLAHDAVQEVFLRIVQTSDSFRGDAKVLTWVYSIATLHCLQQIRNQRRNAQKLANVAQAQAVTEPTTPGIEDQFDLQAVMAAADPVIKQIVVLRIVDEMTVEDVAAVVGLSRKTVTKKLTRFLEEGRAMLSQAEAHPKEVAS
jgi:RNA polymerase sigma-70 factor (ECF subfamily)